MKDLIFLLCLAAVSCRQVPENEFHIEGRLTGIRDSTVISLVKYEGNVGRRFATDTLINGRFSFVYPLTENASLSLSGPYNDPEFPSMGREIWAAPGEKATVTGNNTLIYTWKVKSRVPEQKEADRYMLRSETEYNLLQQTWIERDKLYRLRSNAQKPGKDKLNASLDSLERVADNLFIKISRNDIDIMNKTDVSEIWLDQLRGLSVMIKHYDKYAELRADAERLYERLMPEQRELPTAQEIGLSLFPPPVVQVGDRMVDAELKDPEGNLHRLSDYLGKYIFLDFWGSGCGPCYESMPELRELKEKYKDVLTIIGINLDTSVSSWTKGTELFGPTWLNLNAPQGNDIQARYGVSGIPHQVIVSPEGIILGSWTGYGKGLAELKLLEHLEK